MYLFVTNFTTEKENLCFDFLLTKKTKINFEKNTMAFCDQRLP